MTTTDQTHQVPVPTTFPEPGQDAPPTPKSHGKRPWLIGGAIAGAIAAVTIAAANTGGPLPVAPMPAAPTSAATTAAQPATFTINGGLALHEPIVPRSGTCGGTGGFSDIRGGTGITVWNASGTIVGAGTLDLGTVAGVTCVFTWHVDNVPAGQGPYQYEIAHRGRLTMTESSARGMPIAELGEG
jgi:hypothetical protein